MITATIEKIQYVSETMYQVMLCHDLDNYEDSITEFPLSTPWSQIIDWTVEMGAKKVIVKK